MFFSYIIILLRVLSLPIPPSAFSLFFSQFSSFLSCCIFFSCLQSRFPLHLPCVLPFLSISICDHPPFCQSPLLLPLTATLLPYYHYHHYYHNNNNMPHSSLLLHYHYRISTPIITTTTITFSAATTTAMITTST